MCPLTIAAIDWIEKIERGRQSKNVWKVRWLDLITRYPHPRIKPKSAPRGRWRNLPIYCRFLLSHLDSWRQNNCSKIAWRKRWPNLTLLFKGIWNQMLDVLRHITSHRITHKKTLRDWRWNLSFNKDCPPCPIPYRQKDASRVGLGILFFYFIFPMGSEAMT